MSEADTTVGQLVEPAAEEVTAPVEDPSTGDGATQPAGEEEKEAGNPAAPDTDAAAATAAAVAARLIQQHEEQAGAVYGSNPYDVSQVRHPNGLSRPHPRLEPDHTSQLS